MMERNENRNNIKELLAFMRDGMAYVFSWLVICVIAVGLISGRETVTVAFLLKVFVLCLWGVIAFSISFKNRRIQKKGFVFSLTVFYILFIPVEIAMFYFMGVFTNKGSIISWIVFGAIVVLAYVIAVLIDVLVMRKKAEIYTKKMNEYIKG